MPPIISFSGCEVLKVDKVKRRGRNRASPRDVGVTGDPGRGCHPSIGYNFPLAARPRLMLPFARASRIPSEQVP
jgi:hypothetical protein